MADDKSGRRVHERYACELPVTLVSVDREIEGKTVNLSLGGMFVAVREKLPFGSRIKARFRLPALKEPTELDVTVRWTTPEGVGVQFGVLRAVEVWGLNELFKSSAPG